MLASPRCPGPLRLALLLAVGLPALLTAEPIHIAGRVQISADTVQGLGGARVELLPQTGEAPVATAKTDTEGFFELTAPESGCFRVRVRAQGYASLENPLLPVSEETGLLVPLIPPAQVKPGVEIDGGWIVTPAAARPSPATPRLVQGKVSDPKGAPVPGALVWSEGSPAVPCVKAGADGSFQIRLPAGDPAKPRAVAPGYFPSDPRPGPPFVLQLAPAGAIAGRVVDAAGQPLGKVQIKATPSPWRQGGAPSPTWSRTDGRFRLSRLPPGKLYEVTATHDGFAPASVKVGSLSSPKPVRIVLERGATVLGMVLDPEGQPVPGAALAIWVDRGDGFNPRTLDASAGQAVSDLAGSFAIPHLGAGRFELRLTRQGFVTLSVHEIEVPDRTARVDLGPLTLARGAVIEGRVTDPDDAPVPEAQVTLSPTPDPLAPGFSAPGASSGTPTDSEGYFRFEDLRRDARFNLRVERFGFLSVAVPAVEAPTPEPLRIELKAGRTVAGRVKSPEGRPVPQAQVSISSSTGWTDEDGRFRLAGVPPGVAELTVSAEGYPPARVQDLRIPEESDVEGLEIALHQGSVLEVQVLDSRRQPVAEIPVSACALSSRCWDESGSSCQTDSEGRCRIGGIDTGPYDVRAQSEKYGLAQGTVEIGSGINRQELVFPPVVLVSGRVSDEADAPVAGATLRLSPIGPGLNFQASSLADGSFQFSAVRDGTYRLSGEAPGFASAVAPDEVQVAGQEVRGLAVRLSAAPR